MTEIHDQQKKRILADPVAVYTGKFPDATAQQVSALNELSLEYAQHKRRYNETRNKTGSISRQIGEAKRSGTPVDEFMASMREQSIRLNTIAGQLTDTERRILNFFANRDASVKSDSPSLSEREERTYPASLESSKDVSISLLDGTVQDWNSYVAANPAASIYHRAEWRDLIHRTFGHKSFYFLARSKSGNIVGVLPLIRLKSHLLGNFLVSMPYFNYGGAIGDHPSIEQKLMAAANDRALRLGVSHVEYRDDIQREGLPVRAEKVNMILNLPDSHEALWNGFTSKLRAQIRRPLRENPEILCGGEEYLDDFYTVFARHMRDLGTPVYGKSFFRNILQSFPENSRIMVVRIEHRPVAAGFLIGHRDTLEIPWASAIRAVNHMSVNMLLYWEVLKLAIEQEYRYFDFGRSSRDSGTFRFKQQWGAKARQLYWHYWLNGDRELPLLNPNNPKYALAINIWKRLPLVVTKWLGPPIIRNLP